MKNFVSCSNLRLKRIIWELFSMFLKISQKCLGSQKKTLSGKISMKLCQNLCENSMTIFWNHGERELHGLMFTKSDLFWQWQKRMFVFNLSFIWQFSKERIQSIFSHFLWKLTKTVTWLWMMKETLMELGWILLKYSETEWLNFHFHMFVMRPTKLYLKQTTIKFNQWKWIVFMSKDWKDKLMFINIQNIK